MSTRLLFAICTVLCIGCSSVQPTNPNYPEPEVEGASLCSKACKHAAELSCKISKPTPNGATCEQVCKKYTPPSPIGLRPRCMISSATCSELEGCTY